MFKHSTPQPGTLDVIDIEIYTVHIEVLVHADVPEDDDRNDDPNAEVEDAEHDPEPHGLDGGRTLQRQGALLLPGWGVGGGKSERRTDSPGDFYRQRCHALRDFLVTFFATFFRSFETCKVFATFVNGQL